MTFYEARVDAALATDRSGECGRNEETANDSH
jgi:hypothetical protein